MACTSRVWTGSSHGLGRPPVSLEGSETDLWHLDSRDVLRWAGYCALYEWGICTRSPLRGGQGGPAPQGAAQCSAQPQTKQGCRKQKLAPRSRTVGARALWLGVETGRSSWGHARVSTRLGDAPGLRTLAREPVVWACTSQLASSVLIVMVSFPSVSRVLTRLRLSPSVLGCSVAR